MNSILSNPSVFIAMPATNELSADEHNATMDGCCCNIPVK